MKYKVGLTDRPPRRDLPKRVGSFSSKSHAGVRFNASTKPNNNNSAKRLSQGSSKSKGFWGINLSHLGKFSPFSPKAAAKGKRAYTPGKLSKSARFKTALAKFFVFSIATLFFGGIITFFALGVYLRSLQRSLPDPDRLLDWNPSQTTVIYDRNGVELYKFYGEQNREFVSIDEIPEHTKLALIAAEDVDFYTHKGVDVKGIIGCAVKGTQSYLTSGSTENFCGASTISQQLVRNTIAHEVWGEEAFTRDLSGIQGVFDSGQRKIREWLLTMQVEKTFTKDEILQMYMNEINLGGVNYGYQAASQSYFGKRVQDLTLAESAIIAGIIQAPSTLAPLYGDNQEGTLGRQTYVLDMMEKHKDVVGVDLELIDAARNEEIVYKSAKIDIKAYHFVFYVKQYLDEKYGADIVNKGGLKVYTTLDWSTQKIAEEEIRDGIKKYGLARNTHNGALVAMDPKTGQILAMVGSIDPFETEDKRIDGSVNITTSERQVGSSVKPYVYLTAWERYGPWMQVADIPYNFGGYRPKNWDGRYSGFMTARQALVQSRNLPANYSMQLVGIDTVLQNVEKMGITTLKSKADYGLSLALGSGEMKLLEHTQGFTVFANGGIRRDATPIMKIEDRTGKVIDEYKDNGKRIFDEKDIYLVNYALCDLGGFRDQPSYNEYVINGRRMLCGKTGTTDGPKDLTSMMYHKNLVVGIWTGNNNNAIMGPNAWSTNIPLPIASSFMKRVADKYKPELFTRPSGVLATTVCKDTGRVPAAGSSCEKEASVFVQGRGPSADKREAIVVCKDGGKKASNAEVATSMGLTYTKYLLNYTPENPSQVASYNKHIDELVSAGKSSLLTKEPEAGNCTLPLGPDNAPIITISSPTGGSSFTAGNTINISVQTRALESAVKVQYYLNGSPIGVSESAPFSFSYAIPNSTPSGNYVLSATVYDNLGKTGAASVNISITGTVTPISITLTSPTPGTYNKLTGISLGASVSGATPTSVTFKIRHTDSGTNYDVVDNNAGGGWSGLWVNPTAPSGAYTVTAVIVVDGNVYSSPAVSVTVN